MRNENKVENKVKLLRAFLIETKTTQAEFSHEVGICERTLRTAIKTGKVSEETWNKILDAMLAETLQIQLIKPEEQGRVPNYVYTTLKVCYVIVGVCAVLMLLNAIFG